MKRSMRIVVVGGSGLIDYLARRAGQA